jgi:hypothetical protein
MKLFSTPLARTLDEYDLLAQELDVVGPAMSELDEYKSFITKTPIAIDCSPLTWWLREEQSQRYPRLSKMAIDILSIPAMSAEHERVFFRCAPNNIVGQMPARKSHN